MARATWRDWLRYFRADHPDPGTHYDLRGDRVLGGWLGTPLANMGFWRDLDPTDPDAVEQANRALFELVADDAGIQAGDHVLDAGAGFAVNAIGLAERRHARVTGMNVSRVQTDIGINLVHAAGLDDQIELVVGDATTIPLPDATIDRVVSVEAAFHFASRDTFFEEAYRVLRPGGTLSLVDVVPLAPAGIVQRLESRILRRALAIPADNFYGIDAYVERVRTAGFVDVRSESIVEQTYRPYRRWVRATLDRDSKNQHPFFAIPSMVFLVYPVDYIRLSATRPTGS